MKSGDAFPPEGELESNGPLCRILVTSDEHARARAVNPRVKEGYFAILKEVIRDEDDDHGPHRA